MCSQGYVLNKFDFFTSDDQISQSSGNSYSLIPSRSPTYTTTETLINNMPVLSNNIENEKEKNCIMEIEPMSQKKTEDTLKESNGIVKSNQEKEKIFNILKINKKKGRLTNIKKEVMKGKHNKFTEDNLIRKIKGHFINILLKYINYIYEKTTNTKRKLLQKINPTQSKEIKRDSNLKWFNSTLRQVFSVSLSSKCKNYATGNNVSYNKMNIDKLYKENKENKNKNIEIIKILDTTIKEMYTKYINGEKFDGFTNLYEKKEELKQKMENDANDNSENTQNNIDENEKELNQRGKKEQDCNKIREYLEKYLSVAQKLEQIFIDKKGRKSKVNKGQK
jgi:hypothetical protein